MGNFIGAEGASALAAVLKETMISHLKCAVPPLVFAFVSAPVDTPQYRASTPCARSLRYNRLGPEGVAALVEGLKGNSTLQSLK